MQKNLKHTLFAVIATLFATGNIQPLSGATRVWSTGNSDLTLSTNWTLAITPVSGDTAEFDGAAGPSTTPFLDRLVSTSTTFEPTNISFTGAPLAYTFDVNGEDTPPFAILGMVGPGTGVDNSILGVQTFNMTRGGAFFIDDSKSLDSGLTGLVTYNVDASTALFVSELQLNNARAGKAHINVGFFSGAPAQVAFTTTADAEQATLQAGSSNGTIGFIDNSTANSSTTTLTNGGQLVFQDAADVANATMNVIDLGSLVDFNTATTSSTGKLFLINGGGAQASQSIVLDRMTSDVASQFAIGPVSLTVANPNNGDLIDGPIDGGNLSTFIKQGPNLLTVTNGLNSYEGGTAVEQGILAVSPQSLPVSTVDSPSVTINPTATLQFSVGGGGTYAGNIGNDGIVLVTNQSTTLSGDISGTGRLTADLNSVVTLTGINTYSGGTKIDNASTLTVNSTSLPVATAQPSAEVITGMLIFNQLAPGSFAGEIKLSSINSELHITNNLLTQDGPISAGGKVFVDSGSLTLTNTSNSYTGGTTVQAGATLTGDSFTIPGNILDDGTTVFNQNSNGTFAGAISSTGAGAQLIKSGPAILELSGVSGGFLGTTLVQQGELRLNSLLGGNVTVDASARLSGNGVLSGNLTVNGTIAPGNSIGTLTVNGDYSQSATGIYEVEIDGFGASDLIVVHGNATLDGAVNVTLVSGVLDPSITYLIMHIDGTRSGQFANVVFTNDPSIIPVISYVAAGAGTDVFLNFGSGPTPPPPPPPPPPASAIPVTYNQTQVFDQLVTANPAPIELQIILAQLTFLAQSPDTLNQVRETLDQMSGEQYTNLGILAELGGHQFIKRLYDPLRSIVTTRPCRQYFCCDFRPTFDAWLEAGGGRTFVSGTSNCNGFNTNTYEITGGFQSTVSREFTVGVAGSFVNDQVDYHVGGSGKNRTGYAGVYGLYRPSCWYLMGDIAFSYNESKMHRSIHVSNILSYQAHSKPKAYLGMGYIEAGLDCPWRCLLVQPFIGLEASYFKRQHVTESNASVLNLFVSAKNHANVNSRIGVHLTTHSLPNRFSLSFDLAWQYRLTALDNNIQTQFREFGTPFEIKGLHFRRSSIDAALTLSTVVCDRWELFAEMSGERWSRASTYSILGGIKFSW